MRPKITKYSTKPTNNSHYLAHFSKQSYHPAKLLLKTLTLSRQDAKFLIYGYLL